jgi:putative SOS response-associated peptidase YedK
VCFSYAINFSATALQSKLQLGDGDLEIQLPWEVPTAEIPSPEIPKAEALTSGNSNIETPVGNTPDTESSAPQSILPGPGYFLSGFDRPLLPVVTAVMNPQNPTYNLSAMHWGLVPHWCKSPQQAKELSTYGLNARTETLTEKPLFRDAWKSQPCLVPVSGFFEWQAIGKKKQPHYIYASDLQPLLFAGIYAQWTDTETGELQQSYAIITTDANPLMREIHNVKLRMPVILETAEAKAYLLGDATLRETLLKPCDNAILTAHPVASWLNHTRANRNVKEALLPIEKDFPQTLF